MVGGPLHLGEPHFFEVIQITAMLASFRSLSPMHVESEQQFESLQQLTRAAEHLEQLACLVSRPDSRLHIWERAADCLAKAALIRAARGPVAERI